MTDLTNTRKRRKIQPVQAMLHEKIFVTIGTYLAVRMPICSAVFEYAVQFPFEAIDALAARQPFCVPSCEENVACF